MSAQTSPLTERQLDLITRAHGDAAGLIEPLLTLKGGAKLKMIASLAKRGLIEQLAGQWRITGAAIAIIRGEAPPQEVLPPSSATGNAAPPEATDPEIEAAVAAAESNWATDCPASKPRTREHSKQASVIQMLQRPEGCTIAQVCASTGWQAHTVRGTFANALKKKLGLAIVSDKAKGGERVYRIA